MLRGAHDLAGAVDPNLEEQPMPNGRPHFHQHQHSASTKGSFRGRQSESGSLHSKESYQADEDTSRTSTSESKNRRNSQDPSPRVPGIGSRHEVTALRKHVKILEDRLRGERHTHAVKFSEIEKQLIQENAKLKVSTSALQRQIRREQQLISEHETELKKLKKEKKNRFSISGITRSFSDVRLEDMEMKESSLKRKNTDSEVVRIIKERLDDSEKDRAEGEALFNQRISSLLRERNIERADLRIAEEAVSKLAGQKDALQKDMDDMRFQRSEMLEKSYQGDSMQVSLLKRANSQLQEELDHFHREREKLLTELETISEELSLAKANERQTEEHHVAAGDMKSKIDTLRSKLSSLERKTIQDVELNQQEEEDSFSDTCTPPTAVPSTSTGKSTTAVFQQKVLKLEKELKEKKRELIEGHRKLVNILELSQRYEFHCYNLEKELSKIYGKNYQYVETDWRKKDNVLIENLRQVLKRTVETQTEPMAPPNSGHQSTHPASVHPFPSKKISFFAATQTDASSDATRLSQSRQEIQSLQGAYRSLQEKYKMMETQLQDLSEDDGVYDEPITQAEINSRIVEAQKRVAQMETGAMFYSTPVLAASNPFASNPFESPEVNYTTEPSSGIWTSWSSGSSTATNQERQESQY